jgi:hypothetical protein
MHRPLVVAQSGAVGVLALPTGAQQLVEIGFGELTEPTLGLDQQPAHDLRSHRDPGPLGEPQLGRGA